MNAWDEIEKGIGAAYHTQGYYARTFSALRARFEPLDAQMQAIANSAVLPDGDGVNIPTQLWAEDWVRAK